MRFMQTNYYAYWNSPIGYLTLGVSPVGLSLLSFGKQRPEDTKGIRWIEASDPVQPYGSRLDRYFQGEVCSFDFALDLGGTAFQNQCWQALLKIPYGQTRSYGEIARQVGKPQAFRAVGGANHRNPIAIVVPCHRVIASDKTMGGYGGGLKIKEYLLRLEGVLPKTLEAPERI